MGLLINDGYTITATVTIAPWPAVTIQYRPALPEKVYDWQSQRTATGKDRLNAVCKLLSGNLLSWDLKANDSDETTIPCVESNWRKVPHPVLERFVDLVTGYAQPEGAGPN